MGVQVLDCTLRDGGYINNWEFGKQAICSILDKLESGGIDIIECGFLTSHPRGEDCSLFASPRDISPLLPQRTRNAMFVAMIAIGERELPPDRLPAKEPGGLDGIRLTFHREETDQAVAWAGAIMAKGYRVFLQPVGTAFYSDLDLLKLVERVNQLKPFAFYIVDTLGSMYRNQVTRQFHLIDENMDPDIRLGFHGHNNLQLAFSNAQVLSTIQTKRDLILDSSVYGMGRGAGNLPTELITRYINKNIQSRYNVAMVMDIYDEYIAPLRKEFEWGYTMAYQIAAIHACHPNYAAYLLNKQTLTMTDIESILRSIPQQHRVEFDRELVRQLYRRYQSKQIDDSKAVEELSDLIRGRHLLVLAPGQSLRTRETQVLEFIRRRCPFVIAVNFADPKFQVEACFVSNHKRLDIAWQQFSSLPGIRKILTSNLAAYGDESCLYVDYDRCANEDQMVSDNAGLMLLKLLERCGAKKVYLAGFDGFRGREGGFYNRPSFLPWNSAEAFERQRRMKEQLGKLSLDLVYVTPSAYEEKEGAR